MAKRIKLEEPITTDTPFTHACAICSAYLFMTDNYCPSCGEHVSDEVVIGVVKIADMSDDDYNKPMEEPV